MQANHGAPAADAGLRGIDGVWRFLQSLIGRGVERLEVGLERCLHLRLPAGRDQEPDDGRRDTPPRSRAAPSRPPGSSAARPGLYRASMRALLIWHSGRAVSAGARAGEPRGPLPPAGAAARSSAKA